MRYKSHMRSIEQAFDEGVAMMTSDLSRAQPVVAPPVGPGRLRPLRRPAQGSGRGVRPQLRPVRREPGTLRPRPGQPRACTGAPAPREWRLTERGLALIALLAGMIVLAAVTVVGLTAWRVTGEDYTQPGVSQLASR